MASKRAMTFGAETPPDPPPSACGVGEPAERIGDEADRQPDGSQPVAERIGGQEPERIEQHVDHRSDLVVEATEELEPEATDLGRRQPGQATGDGRHVGLGPEADVLRLRLTGSVPPPHDTERGKRRQDQLGSAGRARTGVLTASCTSACSRRVGGQVTSDRDHGVHGPGHRSGSARVQHQPSGGEVDGRGRRADGPRQLVGRRPAGAGDHGPQRSDQLGPASGLGHDPGRERRRIVQQVIEGVGHRPTSGVDQAEGLQRLLDPRPPRWVPTRPPGPATWRPPRAAPAPRAGPASPRRRRRERRSSAPPTPPGSARRHGARAATPGRPPARVATHRHGDVGLEPAQVDVVVRPGDPTRVRSADEPSTGPPQLEVDVDRGGSGLRTMASVSSLHAREPRRSPARRPRPRSTTPRRAARGRRGAVAVGSGGAPSTWSRRVCTPVSTSSLSACCTNDGDSTPNTAWTARPARMVGSGPTGGRISRHGSSLANQVVRVASRSRARASPTPAVACAVASSSVGRGAGAPPRPAPRRSPTTSRRSTACRA